MKKVVCFDSWTGGERHWQRLIPIMNEHSIELLLVHISSWGNDRFCPKESHLGDLLARDIRYYDDSIEVLLAKERPDAAILLSTETFVHRAFLRYCKKEGIQTLHLSHGVESVFGQSGEQDGIPERSKLAHIIYVASKLYKLLTRTLPCYGRCLLKTNARLDEWRRFVSDIYKLAIGSEPACVRASDDAKADYCAVYIEADAKHAKSCFGYTDDEVNVVGNPDITSFGLSENMIGQWNRPASTSSTYMMYIETGLSSQATLYDGTRGFVRHLLKTSTALVEQGITLRLRLKPNQVNTNEIITGIANSEIELISNEKFITSLEECIACICETSTLALTPAYLGMPIMLANYGDLSKLKFGSVLLSYPRSYILNNIYDAYSIAEDDNEFDKCDELKAWLARNTGPLPSSNMPQRVASVIDKMIANRHTLVITQS